MKRYGFSLVPLVMVFFAVMAEASEDVRARLARAEEDVALAAATEARIAERLAALEAEPEASEEALAAMGVYLEEVTRMREGFEETLRALETLAAESPDPAVAEGMRSFSDALAVLPEVEEDDELARMIAEFDESLSAFDGVIHDHLASLRTRMDRRLDAGSAAAGPRARAAAEAAELLRSMGVDPGIESDGEAGERPRASAGVGEGTGASGNGRAAGRHEDIVARQLREAAEKETDPELREKLWAEYEAYLDGRS